ncbi:MAG: hypothetical protein PHU64_07710 [Candidatus Omnitrophica bacterium]|nr:hypothetical protein [Candidatus Omnitrophota bacterium]
MTDKDLLFEKWKASTDIKCPRQYDTEEEFLREVFETLYAQSMAVKIVADFREHVQKEEAEQLRKALKTLDEN